jgi:replicative DNA helicase Mcm
MDEDLTAEDIEAIKALSKDPHVLWKMARSMAPHVYGLDFVKLGLMLQLFGGVPREAPDVPLKRGDIHILLLGDPGTAKSQLGRAVANIHPRGIMADGGSSSAVGLTAAAVKNKDDVFCIEAGALVMADEGFIFLDELDKLGEYDSGKLNEAMESQTISLNKAGAHVQLNSRCSVLAAANPKHDRFDAFSPLLPQINIVNQTTLSRFDVIFFLKDHAEEDEEEEVSRKMLSEVRKDAQPFTREVEVSMIRKYVAFARENVDPDLTDAAEEFIFQSYMTHRKKYLKLGMDDTGIAIDRRKLWALVRLAQASARSRLSREVSLDDAELAVRVMFEWSLGNVVSDIKAAGEMLLDVFKPGTPGVVQAVLDVADTDEYNVEREAYQVCQRLSTDALDSWFTEKDFKDAAKDGKFRFTGNIKRLLDRMHSKGWLVSGGNLGYRAKKG